MGLMAQKGGYFRLKLHSEDDAIRVAIQLRRLGMGLCYYRGQNMVSWNYLAYDSVIKTLAKVNIR